MGKAGGGERQGEGKGRGRGKAGGGIDSQYSHYTGCPKKTQKLLKSPMLTFECPSTC